MVVERSYCNWLDLIDSREGLLLLLLLMKVIVESKMNGSYGYIWTGLGLLPSQSIIAL
jgi:hypothetical protein